MKRNTRYAIAALLLLAAGLSACGGDGRPSGLAGDEQPPEARPPADWHLGMPRIYLSSLDGGPVIPLARGSHPAWSPDGREIAFVRDRAPLHTEIILIDSDGASARTLGTGADPAWSPDGKQLLFNGLEGISRMNVDGTGTILLIGHQSLGGSYEVLGSWEYAQVGSPSWSPDGQHIAFAHFGFSNGYMVTKLYLMNADGSGAHRLTDSDDGRHELQPSWSPDGSSIAYLRFNYELYASDSDESVVKVGPNGGAPSLVHSGTPYDNFASINPASKPAWSPDGSTIAFTAGFDGLASIWAVPAAGGGANLLIPDGFDSAWGPDGRIAYASWDYCANEWVIVIWIAGPHETPSDLYHGPTPASRLDVRVGGAVEWVSRNRLPPYTSHIVSTSHPPGGTPFDSGLMEPGDPFRFTPDIEGTWTYVELVSGMTGTFTADLGTSLPGLNCSSPGDIE